MSPSLRPVRSLVTVLPAAALALVVGWGCSAKKLPDKQEQEPPTPLNYAIDFFNQQNAVGSALVQVTVFRMRGTEDGGTVDRTSRIAFCNELKSRRQNRQELREPDYIRLGETPLTSPCDVVALGTDGGVATGRLEVPFGSVAILVVAYKNASQEVLLGCADGDVTSGTTDTIVIPLTTAFDRFTAIDSFPLCNRLVDRCNGAANCPAR